MAKQVIPEVGAIVESTSGSDEGKFYIVTGYDEKGYLLLTDGARHKLGSPKRKNVRHIKPAGSSVKTVPKTDAAVVTALRRGQHPKNLTEV